MTNPLPPIPEDPAFLEGQQVKAAYAQQSQQIREDFGITDVVKAEQITAAWEAANATITRLWLDLQARRQARVDTLEATIPIGPGIPPNTSPADTAVLMQAWRGALAQAQAADPATLENMLAEAQRFGDDMLLRAVLTASCDGSPLGFVHKWDGPNVAPIHKWAEMNGATDTLDELTRLYADIDGSSAWQIQLVAALSQIDKPQEAWNLPALTAARDTAIQQAGAARSRIGLANSW
jgi:hypothetical protein